MFLPVSVHLEQVQKTAIAAAQEGSRILKSYFGRVHDISVKNHAGLVTEADRAAEKGLIAIIQQTYPDHSVLAEESGMQERSSEFKWIIDPLDGTTNYAHQIPIFCTSVGVEQNGVIVVAAVSNPVHNILYTAMKGSGAYCNGSRMAVSQTRKLRDCLVATGFAYQKGKALDKAVAIMRPFMELTRGIRRCGSAVWDLCQVAEGHFDGFWEKNLQPWDVATGFLLIEEAGGLVTRFDGSPATVYDQEVVASNRRVHPQMIKLIQTS